MPWNCLCSSPKKSKKSKYNKNIKSVPENAEPEKKQKAKFYNNLRLDQCEKNPKTNNSSSLDSQFDQKSINELNEHLYDSYDTLPNLKLNNDEQSSKNNLNGNGSLKRAGVKYEDDNVQRPKHLILCISNENLPFIDSPQPPQLEGAPGCSRYHNERFIQLMPRNLIMHDRHNIATRSNLEKLHEMQSQKPSHKYIEIDVMDSQICQKCHKVLSFKKTYKCTLCDYTCHQHCATDKPEVRYTDTAYLIFRQWDKINGILAYPTCLTTYKSRKSAKEQQQPNGKIHTGSSYDDRAQQQPLEKIESISFSSSPVPPSSSQYNQHQLHNGRSKTPTSISPNTWQLCYVTERILAAILPAKENQHHSQKIDDLFYDENGNKSDKYEKDLLHMLEQKHGKNFRLFDLESCIQTVSLEKLCELCKHIETWLNGGQNKIVVLQDRESFQRVGTCVAAYLQYQKICSSNLAPYSLKAHDNMRNIQDLDEYSMQKFLDDTVGPISHPSYRRYLEYFIGLLSGEIKINSLPLYLKFIKMESPPCMHHKVSKYETEWSSFIKIFEGERFVFISDIYVMPISTKQFIYEIKSPINLRGDVFIHFFQVHNKSRQTELISSIQFHTCAISRNEIEFYRNDISFPHSDEKFPMDHKVTLIFTKTPEKVGYNHEIDDVLIFQNPLIRKEPISNYSSIADLSQYTQHTQGPLDGSLYATIAKNSPGNNELTVQNIQTIETRLNTPISKNSRILSTILEWDNVRNENGLHNNHVNGDGNYSQVVATTSSSARSRPAPIEPPPRSYVKSPLQRSYDSGIYSHEVTNKNNTSSALSWHDRASPTANNCHDELDNLLSEMLLTVEALPDIQYNGAASKQKIADNYTSKSASSPIPLKSASVSENIHTTETIKRSPKSPYSHSYDTFSYSKNNQQDIGETSSITTTLTPTESGRNTPALSEHQFSKSYYTNQDELFYDTDTQMQLHGNSKRYHAHSHDGYSPQQKQTENLLQSQSQSYMEVLRSENSSTIRSGRSSRFEESNIPYHAREYSKPFTYLPSTGDAKMLNKMQSGLSSPSMVRKALNNGTSGRKTPSQVDFVERTRTYGGRQYNENKYTFGDKTPESNLSVFDNFDYNSRNRSENSKNNYSIEHSDVEVTTTTRQFEPLRRSNTMDGSFGRSGYASDGGSSQTWLQVQQQRLRAKHAQRQHEGFDLTDGAISRRSQTLSPVRQHYNNNYTLTTGKEPKVVQVKQMTQTFTRPYKNEVEMNNHSFDYNQNRTVSPTYARSSYNEKSFNNHNGNGLTRRSMPITSTPNEEMDRINNNNPESPKSPLETLDNLLESIAFESHTIASSTYAAVNGDNNNNNNSTINQKTDTLNRYLDNVINYNNVIRKSDSDSSQSSDHHNLHGKVPLQQHQYRRQTRNESVSSYRSETETEVSRPETPAFPVTPRTPIPFGSTSTLPPKSPTLQRRDLSNRIHEVANINETVSTYTSRRNSANSAISNANSEPFEIAPHHVKFARDSSRYWYKPTLSREEAINLLRNAAPGTFLVRDSTTFANAFGLVVRVAQPPPGSKGGIDELVRHFLVEPTVRGVRLKGCSNEPVFSSLSALIYQHSVTPLALPCRLILPERDLQQLEYQQHASQQLAVQGAACNVLYLFSADTESLTGPQAVRKAVRLLFERRPLPSPTEVHLKVSNMGITLTDNSRQLFFRKHYPALTISYIGLDPDDHRWSVQIANADIPVKNQHIFAFVAKKTATSTDNQCHIFCELETRQPASAIVSFAQKVLMDEATRQQHAPAQI